MRLEKPQVMLRRERGGGTRVMVGVHALRYATARGIAATYALSNWRRTNGRMPPCFT